MEGPALRLLPTTDRRGRALFRLIDPYDYRLGPGLTIHIPAGYVTNFGTIPRWLSWFVSPVQLREAAIVHDWMCSEVSWPEGKEFFSGYSRWIADAVLYDGMARLGFGWFRRSLVFAAVRSWAIWSGQTTWPLRPQKLEVH